MRRVSWNWKREVWAMCSCALMSMSKMHTTLFMTPTPSSTEQYDELVAAIVKAVPEIMEWRCERCRKKYAEYVNGCVICWNDDLPVAVNRSLYEGRKVSATPRPITLEDVLRATNGIWMGVSHTGYMARMNFTSLLPGGEYWHLGHDLEWHKENAPETILFLHSLLCSK